MCWPRSRTHRQVLPQAAVLLPHREAPALLQLHARLRREAGAEFPQHRALEVGQDPVHVHQHPQRRGRAAHPDPRSRIPALRSRHTRAQRPRLRHTRERSCLCIIHMNMHEGAGRRAWRAAPRGNRVGSTAGIEKKPTKAASRHSWGPRGGRDAAATSPPEEKEAQWSLSSHQGALTSSPGHGACKGNINFWVIPHALAAAGAGHGAHQLQGTPHPRWRRGRARQSKSSSVGSAPQGRASPAGIWKARVLSGTGSSRRVEKAPADTGAPYRASAVAYWAAEPCQDSTELHGLVSIPPPPFYGPPFFSF